MHALYTALTASLIGTSVGVEWEDEDDTDPIYIYLKLSVLTIHPDKRVSTTLNTYHTGDLDELTVAMHADLRAIKRIRAVLDAH